MLVKQCCSVLLIQASPLDAQCSIFTLVYVSSRGNQFWGIHFYHDRLTADKQQTQSNVFATSYTIGFELPDHSSM